MQKLNVLGESGMLWDVLLKPLSSLIKLPHLIHAGTKICYCFRLVVISLCWDFTILAPQGICRCLVQSNSVCSAAGSW